MRPETLIKGFWAIWMIYALAGLAATAGLIWVVIHFVARYW